MLKSMDVSSRLFETESMNNQEEARDYFPWSSPHPSTQGTRRRDFMRRISRASHQAALPDKNSLVAGQSSL